MVVIDEIAQEKKFIKVGKIMDLGLDDETDSEGE